jgi:hypothetical protein
MSHHESDAAALDRTSVLRSLQRATAVGFSFYRRRNARRTEDDLVLLFPHFGDHRLAWIDGAGESDLDRRVRAVGIVNSFAGNAKEAQACQTSQKKAGALIGRTVKNRQVESANPVANRLARE